MTYGVLVVDDHAPWRAAIEATLTNHDAWQVVGRAADGGEAIRSAAALRPDLILLDVELGVVSGIDTARRILGADPRARILFVSAHRAWDIAGTALRTGARGYLLKPDVGHQLLPAMETVVHGGRFISAGLLERNFPDGPTAAGHHRPRTHEAAFYENDASMVDALARFAGSTLKVGKTVIVAVTAPRRARLDERLQAEGIDVDLVLRGGKYLPVDVAEMLSWIMTDGRPDEARFWDFAFGLMMRAASASPDDHPHLAACGECASFLVEHGQLDAAIALEHMCDEFARACSVDVCCPYVFPAESGRRDADACRRIGAAHSAVHGA